MRKELISFALIVATAISTSFGQVVDNPDRPAELLTSEELVQRLH